MNTIEIAANVANVQIAGKGTRYAEGIARAVVAATPEEYDWTARGAVPAAIMAACGVTAENAPKQKTGPKGNQTLTDWGRGLDAVAKQVRALIKGDADPKPVVLRATLSGEGGGSTTIPADHPLYNAIVALIAGDKAEQVKAA